MMRLKLTVSFLAVMICLTTTSCKGQTQKQNTNDAVRENLLKQVSQLQEFKQEKMRIDSLSKASQGFVTLTVQVIDTSFYSVESGKNIALAFITEKYPYDEQIMYTVKFDKGKRKIVAVEKNEKAFENSRFTSPDDIVLPVKQ